MRIIAGELRGRHLVAPPGDETRPILDRAKVTLFDWLGSRLAEPGTLPAVPVLDLFAGSGALGIECLSRGASWACFVEKAVPALRALRQNIADLALTDCTRIVRGDALAVAPPAPPDGLYTLIFVDPPYRMTDRPSPGDAVIQRIVELGSHETTAADALLILRQDRHAGPLPDVFGWQRIERREAGTMALTILQRHSP